MKVKLILPALTEATGPFWRPIKYSLFPPLGLATLAGYLSDDDDVEIQDEHVERLHLDDAPDLVVIQVYITSAYRAYRLADHYRHRGVQGQSSTGSRPRHSTFSRPTRALHSISDWRPRGASRFTTGISTTRVTRCFVRR
jgi:hypothetical protein